MNKNIFQKNITNLKKYMPQIYESIDFDNTSAAPIKKTAFNQNDMKLTGESGNSFLYYNNNLPEASIGEDILSHEERFKSQINEAGTGIIFGFGLGYHALTLCYKYQHIKYWYIVEPNTDAFICALENTDLTFLIKNNKVQFVLGDIPLAAALKNDLNFAYRKVMIFEFGEFAKNNKERFMTLSKQIAGLMKDEKIQINTRDNIGKLVITNTLKNLSWLNNIKKLSNLKELYNNKPIVCVAAGPSLNKDIQKLKEAQKDFFIIACDAAIGACLKNDIKPDLITSIEKKELQWSYCFEDHKDRLGDIPLICPIDVHNNIFSKYPGSIIVVDYISPQCLDYYMMDKLYIKPIISTEVQATNVGIFSIRVAYLLGGNPIVLLGQDLAYSDNAGYAEGTSEKIYGKYKIIKKDGKDFIEYKWGENQTSELQVALEENNSGEICAITSQFNYYRRELEKNINQMKTKVYNCSQSGSVIKGTTFIKFPNFIEQQLKNGKTNYPDFPPKNITVKTNKIKKAKTKLLADLQNLINFCSQEKPDLTKVPKYRIIINILGIWYPKLASYVYSQAGKQQKDENYYRIFIQLIKETGKDLIPIIEESISDKTESNE